MKNIVVRLFSPENEFFTLTKSAKRLTHISLSSFILPVVFLIIAGALTQFVFAPLTIGNSGEAPPWIRQVFGLFVLFGMVIILILLWIKFFEGREVYTLGFTKTGWLKYYLQGFGTGVLMVTVVVGIIAIFGNIEIAPESSNITGIDSFTIVLIFLGGFIVQGAAEEILSRGWMMQVIGARYKPWLGVLISSLLFAILHLGNRGITPLPVINLIFFALFMALFVMKDKNLWSVCGWHTSWNWTLGNVYGLSVSGTGEKVTLFDLNTYGNTFISGGGFGPEGSIITTVVLLTGILLLSLIIINKAPIKRKEEENNYSDLLS